MIFCMPRKIALPPSCSCGFRILLAKNGTTNKAMSIEPTTDAITAIGILRINSPAISGINTKGRKAITKVTVHPTTASAICSVPFIAASKRLYPSRIQRSIFSTTTILSSTTNPRATTKPTILS